MDNPLAPYVGQRITGRRNGHPFDITPRETWEPDECAAEYALPAGAAYVYDHEAASLTGFCPAGVTDIRPA